MERPVNRRLFLRPVIVCLSVLLLLGNWQFILAAPASATRTDFLSSSTLTTAAAAPAQADVVRFLEQATFGPNDVWISQAQSLGFESFLQSQYTATPSIYPYFQPFPRNSADGCPAGSPANCVRDNYTMYPLQVLFFQHALQNQDQLRQRVAFALSQILVVSGVQIQQPSSMVPYLNTLMLEAFGNYRQILYDITLNPAMGDYLDMVNNDKPNPATGVEPNENYARELMQLFSIGLFKLNQDGTPQLDAHGEPIPTYDQDTIEGFAHAFTGWTYAPIGSQSRIHNPVNYLSPMILYRNAAGLDTNHDKGTKKVLSYPGAAFSVLPANQDGEVDLNRAIDNIFNHPNVGPFIGKQLIQHLVTSNPSPAYVKRVAAAFNNNGAGVRGDMKAVISAILLDPEARGTSKTAASYGHLREPVLYVTNLLRILNATSDAVLADQARNMGQDLFRAPSVFNYYPPDYIIPGTTILGPEYALQSSSAAMARANFVNSLLFGHVGPALPGGTVIDLNTWQVLASSPASLVDRLDQLFLHGSMSTLMKNEIIDAVNAVPATNAKLRAQTALYLVATSSQYQVER